MSYSQTAARVLVTITLVLLPLILVILTLEPLERSPARAGRNSQVVVEAAPGDASQSGTATPGN
ncbi:MAG: hypothetical protein KC442_19840 [Thermomicrobiales bacterium]|nr:hypothetical protein [Thermomicrobiales bacterium]